MKKKVGIILLVLLVIGAGVGFYLRFQYTKIGNYRGEAIGKIGNDEAIKTYPAAVVEKNQNRLKELAQLLHQDPNNIRLWLEVSQLKKFFNNYRGAVAALEYAVALNADDPLVYYNLANLYGAYLGDYPKAEENYFKAMDRGAGFDYPYLGLAEFYRDFYKEKYDQIEKVLLRGLKEGVSNDPNMIMQLGYYYKSVGNNSGAVTYFSKLLNSHLISDDQRRAFQEEIRSLSAK